MKKKKRKAISLDNISIDNNNNNFNDNTNNDNIDNNSNSNETLPPISSDPTDDAISEEEPSVDSILPGFVPFTPANVKGERIKKKKKNRTHSQEIYF